MRLADFSLFWAGTFTALCLLTSPASAQRLSALAPAPDWSELEPFQETITREEFLRLLDTVYAPGGAAKGVIEVKKDHAVVKKTLVPSTEFKLRFAASKAAAKKVPRYWTPAREFPAAPAERPLEGIHIAIDPGHIGGKWAKMEERWFQIGNSKPVAEGEMTLRVAELVAPQLRALGAKVSFVRDSLNPVTPKRPANLRAEAIAELALQGVFHPTETYDATKVDDPQRGQTVQWQTEILFYRIAEIRQRARIVNEQLQPDLVLCLHFNAESWGGDPSNPQFVPRNHLHMLVNGNYGTGELRFDDQRHDLMLKLLNRTFPEELAATEVIGNALADGTKLPPYQYGTPNAKRIGPNSYVWIRNLLANRLYHAPVVFFEPYVMNSQEVWERVQAGDYEGEKVVAGASRKSIFREYADSVAKGVRSYYQGTRPK